MSWKYRPVATTAGGQQHGLKTLRPHQRPEKIDHHAQRNDSDKDHFHDFSKPPAGVGVKDANRKERQRRADENGIHHKWPSLKPRSARSIRISQWALLQASYQAATAGAFAHSLQVCITVSHRLGPDLQSATEAPKPYAAFCKRSFFSIFGPRPGRRRLNLCRRESHKRFGRSFGRMERPLERPILKRPRR